MGRQKKFVRVFSLTFWALSISVCHLALATVASSDSRHCSRGKCVIENQSNAQASALLTPNKAMHQFPTYSPVVDIAQYALHQGDSRSANLIEGFIPLYQSAPNTLSFADIRFYNPNGTPVEGNIDLGFRRLFHQSKNLFGLYAGYDRYRSETRRYYSQINAGLELWFNRFFIGGNGYLPVGTKVYDNDAVNLAYLVSTNTSYRYNISFEQGKERAMPGGDAEIGYDVTHNLTLYGGGYYFDHSDSKSIAGPKLRATYTFYRPQAHLLLKLFDRIRLEGLISHDSVRGTSWMAGLRFRFGLSKHPNPTASVARHMTDPIRRDLNVVSANFNDSSEFYKIDGRRARMDLVSSDSGQTIDAAISGNADIIGIRGDQTAAAGLVLGNRDLIITGGRFDCEVNGHPYTIDEVGLNGNVVPNNGSFGDAVFEVQDEDGTHTMQLQYLAITGASDDEGIALQTNTATNGFGQINVDHVSSNLPFNFSLAGTMDTLGQVSFTHNKLDIADASPTFSTGGFGAVRFVTSADSQQLTINDFSYNQINITNRTTGSNASGLYVWADSSTPINFSHGMMHNTINVSDNSGTLGDAFGLYQDNADFNGNITDNTFTASGNNTSGIGWSISDPTTIYGDVRDNTFTASGNFNYGVGWLISDSTTIYGYVSENQFIINDNISNNSGVTVQISDQESVTFEKAITSNAFMIDGSSSGNYGFNLNTGTGGVINFNGNSSESELRKSNNKASINTSGSGDINYKFIN